MPRLDHIAILLVEPQSAGNVGAVARVMKNFGFSRLVLIDSKTELTPEAYHRACGADDILQDAKYRATLPEAVREFALAVGTSSRLVEWIPNAMRPSEMASRLNQYGSTDEIALIFGPERTGLTNQHLRYCQWLMTIPTETDFESLNLSHAVAIACYEVRQAWNDSGDIGRALKAASVGQVESFMQGLELALSQIGFLNTQNPQQVLATVRQMLARASLEERDVQILRGILRQWNWYSAQSRREPASK